MSSLQKLSQLSQQEQKLAKKFEKVDFGWIVMSIGMAIGAGIVLLPVQIGVMGIWVFLGSALIGYPAMYFFQKLFINTLVHSKTCQDYPSILRDYLGHHWGIIPGILYFIMLIIWAFIYALTITNDSASYLVSFGVTSTYLSDNPLYSLCLLTALVWIASTKEKFLFAVSGSMAVMVLFIVAVMGLLLIPLWNLEAITQTPDWSSLWMNIIITLPFTLTSILFIQSLSPMVISYRSHFKSTEVARYKAIRAMNIAFIILFCVVFFFAISFTFAIKQEQALDAQAQNISALAIIAQYYPGNWATYAGVLIDIFAVVTSFFGVFLGLREALMGLLRQLTKSFLQQGLTENKLRQGATLLIIVLCWLVTLSDWPILKLASLSGPIFGFVGCLIPAYLVFKIDDLKPYRTITTYFIIFTGILLCVSPLLHFTQ
jgi:serine transporter